MLRPWQFNVIIDRHHAVTATRQIVNSVIEDVRRGRLKPGQPLPGSRELGDHLSLNRKTVVQAYEELEAQGWVKTESRRGTFIAQDLPLLDPAVRPGTGAGAGPGAVADQGGMPDHPFFPLPRPPAPSLIERPRDMLTFNDGAPDMRQVPVDLLARAYRHALRHNIQYRRIGYGDPRGMESLRTAISAMLNTERGLATDADNICLTRGSQMAIFTIAQTLIMPDDVVVFEDLTYPPAREVFRRAGARIATVGVDEHDMNMNDLEQLCRRQPVRAVYVTPHHHFPTTVSMKPERRMRLLLLASQFGFAIIEDDYDHEFHFTHRPMLPLASFESAGHVIYIGSFSKLLSPSLRLGYISAPRSLIDRLAAEIVLIDRQGDPAMESAIADFIEDGELHRHTRKMLRLYAGRRQWFAQCLRSTLGERAQFAIPEGGLAFWVRFPGIDMDRFIARSLERGVFFQPPQGFSSHSNPVEALRLGFASLETEEITAATHRLGLALDAMA